MSITERPKVHGASTHVKQLREANPKLSLNEAGDRADDLHAAELHRFNKFMDGEFQLRLHRHHAGSDHSRNVTEVRAPVTPQEIEAATRKLMPYGARTRNLRRDRAMR